MDVVEIVQMLRSEGSDTVQVEAKRAAGGFPESVAETLSAFANTPGGGVIIFGLDEKTGFAATEVYDAAQCQQAVASLARQALDPPITVTTETAEVDGHTVVLANVPEADRSAKPVRVRRTGRGYLRQYDGDYPLSDLEEQAFVAGRGQPHFDRAPVTEATLSDLDARAVASYLAERRLASPRLAQLDDDELLRRTGVLADNTTPTLAGLLALGIYPQQFVPALGLQASLHPERPTSAVRALDSAFFGGSVPAMLDDASAWVERTLGRAIVADSATGAVRDQSVLPPLAVRELLANALIHRDLGPYAQCTPVSVRLTASELVIANEGGLYGVTVETLGQTPSRLRNPLLAEILQSVRTRDGSRVVERLGSGIPAVRAALAEAGLEPPVFLDQGIRFVAKVTATAVAPEPTTRAGAIVRALRLKSGQTAGELASRLGLGRRQVDYELKALYASGSVIRTPRDGRSFQYMVAPRTA
jgi:ATP-dependent DNA helicase RecG